MEEGGTLNITGYINITTTIGVELVIFDSVNRMYDCEKTPECANDHPMELGVAIIVLIIANFSGRPEEPYIANFTGHHYMSTRLSINDDIYPFNLNFIFALTTRMYDISVPEAKEVKCVHCVCRVQYTWFPWELFHRSCVLLYIHATPAYEKYSTLYRIQQTSHRRTDMIGYFVAFIVVTLFGLFLVYSCPIYRATQDCLQHRYTRRVRHYIGLF